jgi:Binding-protein-dependent transport system inner membrane component
MRRAALFLVVIALAALESARIDGASELQIFVRLILPLGVPAIASLAIFQFLWTRNDLIVAHVRPERAADHGRDLLEPAAVRREHRPDRPGRIHLACRAADRVLRVPALFRAGTPGGIREVAVRASGWRPENRGHLGVVGPKG